MINDVILVGIIENLKKIMVNNKDLVWIRMRSKNPEYIDQYSYVDCVIDADDKSISVGKEIGVQGYIDVLKIQDLTNNTVVARNYKIFVD